MSIDNLRNEVQRNTKVAIRYINYEEKNLYTLSNESPANTNLDVIYVLNSINQEDKIEAEAHELGHLLVKNRGMITLKSKDFYESSYFVLELNNAVSHKYVVNILKDEFDISSDLHLTLRENSIKNVEKDIRELDNIYFLYGIGMKLYDINVTLGKDIEKFTELNEYVKRAVDAAKEWLSQINIDMPIESQKKIIHNMLDELRIPEGLIVLL